MTLIAGSPMIWDNSFSGPSIRAVILRQLPIPYRDGLVWQKATRMCPCP